jgi:hypothetical protein
MKPFSLPAVILGSTLCLAGTAAHADEVSDLFTGLKPTWDLRYRYEYVDQDGLPFHANASTLRIHAGAKTGMAYGFSGMVQFEAVAPVFTGKYNDTTNGLSQYPVVADPQTGVLNQAVATWNGVKTVLLAAGRQAVNLDNQRFIGSVGWRQNDQVLDIATASVTPIKGLTAFYGYSWRVHRIFGPDSAQGTWRNSDINLLHVSYDTGKFGTVTAYGYFLDIRPAPTSSSKTFGARWQGRTGLTKGVTVLYAVEYARQADLGLNPLNFSLDYVLIEPGLSAWGVTTKFGYERLQGNGTAAFQTPLATLHAFNGWADKFLTTPANGLEDLYADITYKLGATVLKGTTLRLVYHDFSSTTGGLHYGTEWDALIARPIGEHLKLTLKFADYNAKAFATDTTKVWLMVDIQ